jgi:hypothetical protein
MWILGAGSCPTKDPFLFKQPVELSVSLNQPRKLRPKPVANPLWISAICRVIKRWRTVFALPEEILLEPSILKLPAAIIADRRSGEMDVTLSHIRFLKP